MSASKLFSSHEDLKSTANTARDLAALSHMSVGELAERYRALFGEPTRSRNKEYLRKRIAWRIQESTSGGLSRYALERIAELAPNAPARWRKRTEEGHAPVPASPPPDRDPRLPPAGSVITRLYRGTEYKVCVLESGFEYSGQRYKSLSKVARLITGSSWNGFVFFFGKGSDHGDAERAG